MSYNLFVDFKTLAEDTDFFNFPNPLLILFPTLENLVLSEEGFSFDTLTVAFLPWCNLLIVELKS